MDIYTIEHILDNLDIFEKNSYFYDYIDLVYKNINTERVKFKTSSHHVIPVAYYKLKYNTSSRSCGEIYCKEDKNNFKINLLYKDHALAHYYLACCAKNERFKLGMICAFHHICGLNKKLDNDDIKIFLNNLEEYQNLKEIQARNMSLRMKGKLIGELNPATRPEVKEKIKQNRKPSKITQELRLKMQDGIKRYMEINDGGYWKHHKKDKSSIDKWIATIQKRKEADPTFMLSRPNLGRVRVTNGKLNKNVKPEEVDYYLSIGFYLGMTKKKSGWDTRKLNGTDFCKSKGKIAVHDLNNRTKYICREELNEYLSKGYILGGAKRKRGKSVV